jgi:hypothetical protein
MSSDSGPASTLSDTQQRHDGGHLRRNRHRCRSSGAVLPIDMLGTCPRIAGLRPPRRTPATGESRDPDSRSTVGRRSSIWQSLSATPSLTCQLILHRPPGGGATSQVHIGASRGWLPPASTYPPVPRLVRQPADTAGGSGAGSASSRPPGWRAP